MRIDIIEIGKTRKNYLLEAEKDYLKRLIPFAKITVTTIKDQGEATSEAQKKVLKEKEAKIILQKIPKDYFVIVLDESGEALNSVELAKLINQKKDNSTSICFIIGGVYGLTKEIKERADLLLSFSRFTFTHELIRTLLLEQLYRSFTIINGKKYHY
jgi:23S rRNA (pseudouridine1915-N3)-methyltransferase